MIRSQPNELLGPLTEEDKKGVKQKSWGLGIDLS